MIRLIRNLAFIFSLSIATQLQAASAVALGVQSNGKLHWSYWKDPKLTEAGARTRALEEERLARSRNQRIVASTSKLGFGTIIMFLTADNRLDYAVALAAPTWESAVNEAKRKAKSAGGRAFKVVAGWNDGIRTNKPIIMQKL